jgi:hypothetical protein
MNSRGIHECLTHIDQPKRRCNRMKGRSKVAIDQHRRANYCTCYYYLTLIHRPTNGDAHQLSKPNSKVMLDVPRFIQQIFKKIHFAPLSPPHPEGRSNASLHNHMLKTSRNQRLASPRNNNNNNISFPLSPLSLPLSRPTTNDNNNNEPMLLISAH